MGTRKKSTIPRTTDEERMQCNLSRPVYYYESNVFFRVLRTITTSMNVLNVLMDKYRTTSSCSLLQNGCVYTKKHNATVCNLVCESITNLRVMRANIDISPADNLSYCSNCDKSMKICIYVLYYM